MPKALISPSSTALYDRDFLLWIEATIQDLRSGDLEKVDLENLIEEITSLGKAQKNAFKGQVRALIAHILKRFYVQMPLEYHGWERTIRHIRPEIEDLIETSPSLEKNYAQILDATYQQALKQLQPEYKDTQFPDAWQFGRGLDDLLNVDFWDM